MNKNLKHIKENTIYIEAKQLIETHLTNTKQISCEWEDFDTKRKNRRTWRGEIQKIYLDKDGEAYAYDIYIY